MFHVFKRLSALIFVQASAGGQVALEASLECFLVLLSTYPGNSSATLVVPVSLVLGIFISIEVFRSVSAKNNKYQQKEE